MVNAAKGLDLFPTYSKHVADLEAKGVEFLHLGWDDSMGQQIDGAQLKHALNFIHKHRRCMAQNPNNKVDAENSRKRGGVLVHCAAGRSRSATVAVAYVAARYGASLQEALRWVSNKRLIARPNDNFMRQLTVLEKEGFFSQLHKEWGLIAALE